MYEKKLEKTLEEANEIANQNYERSLLKFEEDHLKWEEECKDYQARLEVWEFESEKIEKMRKTFEATQIHRKNQYDEIKKNDDLEQIIEGLKKQKDGLGDGLVARMQAVKIQKEIDQTLAEIKPLPHVNTTSNAKMDLPPKPFLREEPIQATYKEMIHEKEIVQLFENLLV